MTWVIMPVVTGREMTIAAINDVLNQAVETKLLIVGQSYDWELRQELEKISEEEPNRVFCWWFMPALPSLSACWNRALQFCWEVGAQEAFVVNNDVRLHQETVGCLLTALAESGALFVTAVGVTKEQFGEVSASHICTEWSKSKGGPDFSAFLISKEGHEKYPFDEMFTPAFAEDCDTHRRYMLGGDGDKIFSINLPYLHLSSQTLKQVSPEKRVALEQAIERGSRAHYARKWGGSVNHERLTIPFDETSAQDGVTNPDLQRRILQPTEAVALTRKA